MKYLYVSRSSLYLPGLPAITPDSLLSLRKTMFGFTDETELDILGNFITSETWHEVECVMRSGSGSGKGEELFANPEVLAILSRYHDTQRDLILRYFIQEGLADPIHKTVVVDIRGTRSCQQAINAILRQGGFRPAKGIIWRWWMNGNRSRRQETTMPYITRSVCASVRLYDTSVMSWVVFSNSIFPFLHISGRSLILKMTGEYGPYLKMEKRRAIHGIS